MKKRLLICSLIIGSFIFVTDGILVGGSRRGIARRNRMNGQRRYQRGVGQFRRDGSGPNQQCSLKKDLRDQSVGKGFGRILRRDGKGPYRDGFGPRGSSIGPREGCPNR